MTFKEKLYSGLPDIFQNLLISIFNLNNIFIRRTGSYSDFKKYYIDLRVKSTEELTAIQQEKYVDFFNYIFKNSPYYKAKLEPYNSQSDIIDLPVLEKEELRTKFDQIRTIPLNKGISKFSGGTTGKPIHIVFTKENIRERSAIIDAFRESFGYTYGKQRIAWFGGRKILTEKDTNRYRYWKTDYFLNVRYYSTFHMSKQNLAYYIDNLNSYKPSYFSGFPSAIYELASHIEAEEIGLDLDLSGIFTTSETLLPNHRNIIERVFNCRVYDQYASAEGAPFITECAAGNLHLNTATGMIEIVDADLKPVMEGEVLVTSFTTRGTPILRYRIGDYIRRSDEKCNCGSNFPVIAHIEGRKLDFIYSKERGKIFNSQVGDCVKADIKGLLNFQVVQNSLDEIIVNLLTDGKFSVESEQDIKDKFEERLGLSVSIHFEYVDEIPERKAGSTL